MLNESIHYVEGDLFCDAIPIAQIAAVCGTPSYVYSLRRIIENYDGIKSAFADFNAHIHYSAKANANLALLKTLIDHGAGIDAVSAGEIYKALNAGAKPENIVFAGVGKTKAELRYAIEKRIGWFNIENADECRYIDDLAAEHNQTARVALRFNPDVAANTHPYIATGHGGAKFGLTADVIQNILAKQSAYPNLDFAGIHIHIGSQLHDTAATKQAISAALRLIAPYPNIRAVNIGGGLPVAYSPDDVMPSIEDFAATLKPLLKDYTVLLEPGRSIVADAGILITQILYAKQQAGQTFYIVDASMSELIRPALYQAKHAVVAVKCDQTAPHDPITVVGPVCETADVLGSNVELPQLNPGDLLAILDTGAYGMAMSSNYNARPRPAEIVVSADGDSWRIARPRETWNDLIRGEST
jgi:diaminopimelate decarboxylase